MAAAAELVWTQSEDVVASALGDRLALLDTQNNVYYSLEGVGPLLWEAIAAGQTSSQLSSLVTDRFKIAGEIAERDIAAWVEQMSTAGLIVEAL